MALTRKDVTIAAIVTFAAWLIAAQWIPVLKYAAYAFVSGIAITMLGLGALILRTSSALNPIESSTARRSTSLAILAPQTWNEDVALLRATSAYEPALLYPPSPPISNALHDLLQLIVQNSITTWYGNISKSPSFSNEVDRIFRAALATVRDRLLSVDVVEVAVSRMVPILNIHLRDAYNAEKAVRGEDLTRNVTESEELDRAIAGKYRDGTLHPAASLAFSDTKLLQQDYLRKVAERLIPEVLPESQTKSRVFEVLVRELLACAVLYPIMLMLSDPDTWNQIMEAYGSTMLQDRKTVRKLRAALDEHASPASKSKSSAPFPKLAPNDNERQFEKFVRAIRKCSDLSEARRFRSEVSSQLKRDSRVARQDPVYLRRLETAKRILDQRVSSLTAGVMAKGDQHPPSRRPVAVASRLENASLSDVLHEASGLSYFMEFMDRQLLMTVVQFWIVVNGFRNPLEDAVAEDDPSPAAPPTWTDSDRTDLAQINQAYLSKPELHVTDAAREAVRAFLAAGRGATPQQYQNARQAILRTQNSTFHEMESRQFPKFKESDLFYKYLTSDEAASNRIPDSPTPQRKPLARATTQIPALRPQPLPAVPLRLKTAGTAIRRAAASSGDLKASSKATTDTGSPRRSLDSDGPTSLSDDNDTDDPLSHSRQSIDSEPTSVDGHDGPDKQVVEVMEAALNDIMEQAPDADDTRSPLFGNEALSVHSGHATGMSRSSSEFLRNDSSSHKDPEKPSIASLGLVNTSSRIGVFSDDDRFPDEEKFLQDEHDDPEEEEQEGKVDEEIHEAAPGDLGLAEAISALTADIERLVAQDSVVDSLTMKAELTNNTAELRILRKSKASLQREIRRKGLQRQQYVVQESDNSLYGRSTVRIKSIVSGTEEDGREYASYVIEVQRKAGEQMPAATWVIARRYSEFHELQQHLRSKYPSVRQLEFPRRRMVMKLQKDFLHKRRLALEKYLRELLQLPDVCRSRDLRSFLSQQAIAPTVTDSSHHERRDIITRFYNSVSDGMDDILGNIPVLDQLSVAGQNLMSAATSQLNTLPPTVAEDPLSAAEVEAELNAFENRELEPFVKPICDIFLEVFELNRGNNWLRGRAVVVILHQLLGGTIERKVRENAKAIAHEDSILRFIASVKDNMAGQTRQSRTTSDKARTRREASVTLATLIPDVAGSVVGRANAQTASRRVFATANNPRLNTHLAFTLLDEVVDVLFPTTSGAGVARRS